MSQYKYQSFVMTQMRYKCQLSIETGWTNSAPHHLERKKSDISVKFLLSDAEECH